jgi:hypothetical protein
MEIDKPADAIGKHVEHPSKWLQPTLSPDEGLREATGPPNPQKWHGYAAVEIQQGTTRVIQWEVEEETRESSPEQSKQQRWLFRLGDWLSRQPISDQA